MSPDPNNHVPEHVDVPAPTPQPISEIHGVPPVTVTLATGQQVRLGRVRPTARPQAVAFKPFFDAGLSTTPAPASVNYLDKAVASIKQMYGNDQWGDCVIAGKFHAVGVWSGNDVGTPVLGTTNEAYKEYQRICGPGDNGCVITEVLNDMKSNGLTIGGKKHKIDGYVSVDSTNKEEVKVAIIVFGGLCIGFNVPSSWMNTPDGGTWDNNVSMNFVGGHDVQIIDYDDTKGVRLSTWAGTRWMTWRALADSRIVDECYAILGPDWYNDDQLAPNGIKVQALKDALAVIGNGGLPPWQPDPVPVPPSPPVPPGPIPPTPVPPTPTPTQPVPVTGSTQPTTISFQVPTGVFGRPVTVSATIPSLQVSGTTVPSQQFRAVLGFSWADIWALVAQYGSQVLPILLKYGKIALPIILADLAQGKSWKQILQDLEAAFGI